MSAASLIRGPLIGTCLASVLYGITCLQAFFYFQTYVNDQRGLKLTVSTTPYCGSFKVDSWLIAGRIVTDAGNDPCCSVDVGRGQLSCRELYQSVCA
ncbi:hypothetical protein EDC04DRAFT_674158 [Pisolithus marmoratus]|nr:hypothetical protein EDC04DRAFT_674158 [Pisolithus marmoratus]